MTPTTTTDGDRAECSEPVRMQLELDDIDGTGWTTDVSGLDAYLVKLDGDAGMDDVTRLHEIAAEFDRTVTLHDQYEYTDATVWSLEDDR